MEGRTPNVQDQEDVVAASPLDSKDEKSMFQTQYLKARSLLNHGFGLAPTRHNLGKGTGKPGGKEFSEALHRHIAGIFQM